MRIRIPHPEATRYATIRAAGRGGVRVSDPALWVSILALSVVLAGCHSFNVQSDWDRSASLDSLERFHFVEPPKAEGADPFADNTLLRKRVRSALEDVLTERGYRSVSTREEADFLVTYSVILDEELRVDGASGAVGGGYYHRGVGLGSVYSTANIRSRQESTLILDLLSPANDELLWRGWGTGIVGTRDFDRRGKRVDAGVRAILAKFPPAKDAKGD